MIPPLPSPEPEINALLRHFSPAIETQLREARARLRAWNPQGFEMVFNNYNALVFGYSATDRAPDAFTSLAGYPRWVTLFFLHGVGLSDPEGLLEGEGKQVRGVRLKDSKDLDTQGIQDLIRQASQPQDASLLLASPLRTIVKMAVPKPRARRPG